MTAFSGLAEWLATLNSDSRILVAGLPGSGKTTIARELSVLLSSQYIELDALYFGPGWKMRDSFAHSAGIALAGGSWVSEFQYENLVGDALKFATHLVFLDVSPAWRSTRVLRRSIIRKLRHQDAWPGVKEPALHVVLFSRSHTLWWGLLNSDSYRSSLQRFSSTNDVNVVSVVGVCAQNRFRTLVYQVLSSEG